MRAYSITLLGLSLLLGGCMFGSGKKDLRGREKANYLVTGIGRRIHAAGSQLDSQDDQSFGDFGFHYDAIRNLLTGRVYITKADLDQSPEFVASIRRVTAALDDPKIGGLFEHGGGHFFLDETKQKLFLVRDFPVDTTDEKELWVQMEDLINLGARWSMKWFRHVARIANGREQLPPHPVSRQNDPYPRS